MAANTNANINSIVFFPYGAQRYFSIGFLVIALSFLFSSLQGWASGWFKIVLIVLCILTLCITWIMSCQSRLKVSIDSEGIVLCNSLTRDSFHANWQDFSLAYYMYDTKGHSYLLFAKNPADENERRILMSKMFAIKEGCVQLSVNGNVCIRSDGYNEQIKSILVDKLEVVDVKYGKYGI